MMRQMDIQQKAFAAAKILLLNILNAWSRFPINSFLLGPQSTVVLLLLKILNAWSTFLLNNDVINLMGRQRFVIRPAKRRNVTKGYDDDGDE